MRKLGNLEGDLRLYDMVLQPIRPAVHSTFLEGESETQGSGQAPEACDGSSSCGGAFDTSFSCVVSECSRRGREPGLF